MKVVFLGPLKDPQISVISFLEENDVSVDHFENNINNGFSVRGYDFLISFGYRYIINKQILDSFQERAINLHVSYLPWNKGADPNLWSFLEETPKGVTIHLLDEKIDNGKIICQKELEFNEDETLESSYNILQKEIVLLFKKNWKKIRDNSYIPKSQISGGSYHRLADKNFFLHLLSNGWKTKIKEVIGKAKNA